MKKLLIIAGNLLLLTAQSAIGSSTTYWQASIEFLLVLLVAIAGMNCWHNMQTPKCSQTLIVNVININNITGEEESHRQNERVFRLPAAFKNKSTHKDAPAAKVQSASEGTPPTAEDQSSSEGSPSPAEDQSTSDDVPLSGKEQSASDDALLPADEQSSSENGPASIEQSQSLDVLPITSNAPKITIPTHHYNFTSSSICLLPTFCVYSSEGEDITARFQPRLRKILVALIVYSVKYKKGISVQKFTDIFWENMSKAQGSNNRNVNISNLRKLLKLVGDVKIINKDGFLRIDFGSGVKCDYLTGMKLLHRYNACGDDGDVKFMECITELLNRGPLVTEMSFDWLDESKNDYSSNSLDMLLRMLQSGTGRVSESDVTRIARLMFMHEPTSEKALAACCAVFIKHDKRSIAKNVFLRFCEDYFDIMGEPYDKTFAEFCKQLIVKR